MHTEIMKNPTHWNAMFGGALLKSCGIMRRRTSVWQWKTAPVAPEIPDDQDDEMDDAPAGDGDAPDDAIPVRPHRLHPPPPPPAPEGGWTIDHVMASMHNLTWGLETLTSKFRGFRQSTGRWRNRIDARVRDLEAEQTQGSEEEDEETDSDIGH